MSFSLKATFMGEPPSFIHMYTKNVFIKSGKTVVFDHLFSYEQIVVIIDCTFKLPLLSW